MLEKTIQNRRRGKGICISYAIVLRLLCCNRYYLIILKDDVDVSVAFSLCVMVLSISNGCGFEDLFTFLLKFHFLDLLK